MSTTFLRTTFFTVAWGLTLTATLSISRLPGNWGHSVCGPWGCGPPTQALVACHVSWLVVLAPLAIIAYRWLSLRHARAAGMLAAMTGLLSLLGTFAFHVAQWIITTQPWQRSFFWQRLGFSVVTQVELPAVQLLLVGLSLFACAIAKSRRHFDQVVFLRGHEKLWERHGS